MVCGTYVCGVDRWKAKNKIWVAGHADFLPITPIGLEQFFINNGSGPPSVAVHTQSQSILGQCRLVLW